MRNASTILSLAALGSVLVLTACPADDADPPPTDDAAPAEPAEPAAPDVSPDDLPEGVTLEMVDQGAQIYQRRGSVCVPCHGQQGEGTALGPSLNDTDWINIDHDYEQIVQVIESGVDPPQEYPAPMPRMGGAHFSDDELRAVAAYVYALAISGN